MADLLQNFIYKILYKKRRKKSNSMQYHSFIFLLCEGRVSITAVVVDPQLRKIMVRKKSTLSIKYPYTIYMTRSGTF